MSCLVADRDALEKFLDKIERKPGVGSISEIEKNFTGEKTEFKDFEIRY